MINDAPRLLDRPPCSLPCLVHAPLQVLFEKWSNHVQKLKPGPSGHVFDIDLKRGEGATALVLSVNFHPSIITISKEVRNLKALGFRVPLVIVNKALQANHLYVVPLFACSWQWGYA